MESILTRAWRKYREGHGLSDVELGLLLDNVEVGINFLKDRGETGAVLYLALQDREQLRTFQLLRNEAAEASA